MNAAVLDDPRGLGEVEVWPIVPQVEGGKKGLELGSIESMKVTIETMED